MLIPFYWLDIHKTENKLSQHRAVGKHTVKFDFLTGNVLLEDGEPEDRTYILRRSPGCRGNVPRKMTENGWTTLGGNRNNYAAFFRGKNSECPSYSGYLRLISIMKIVLFMPLCFMLGKIMGTFAALSERTSLPADNERYIASIGEYFAKNTDRAASMVISLLLMILCAVLIAILGKATKRYEKLNGSSVNMDFTLPSERVYTKEQEKQMLKNKTMKKVFRYGWFLSFDKAEEYVEKMESSGWNFYRFDKPGMNFYFVKGEPRKVRFVVDYQNDISEDYLSMNIEDGWQLKFKSYTRTGGYIVWLKEYEDEVPEFYSDLDSLISRAGKTAALYTLIFIPMVIISVLILTDLFSTEEITDLHIFITAMFITVILEYGFMMIKNLLSYLRVKKKYK